MGNFDYKNICLQIEVRENPTDARYVEFMKDWNFTEKECDVFCESIQGMGSTEISKRIVQFFVEYKDGLLIPDKCGTFEPLRKDFNVENLLNYVSWLSFPAGCLMLKKKYKYSAEISNNYYAFVFEEDGTVLIPKRTLSEYLGRITFWFAKQRKIDMVFLEQLLRDFCSYLDTDVGYIFDQETMTVLLDIFHPERVGTRIDSWY